MELRLKHEEVKDRIMSEANVYGNVCSNMKSIAFACAFGIALNTVMFGVNLWTELHQMAAYNILCACGCWVGYYFYGGDNHGDK